MNPGRRWLVGAVGVVALLVAAHGALWAYAVHAIETIADEQIESARAQGWQISLGRVSRGGWPMAARVTYENARVADVAPAGPGWRSSELSLALDIRRPSVLLVQLTGPHTLNLEGVAYAVRTTTLGGSLTLGQPPLLISVAGSGIKAEVPGGGFGIGNLAFTATHVPQPAAGKRALDLRADLTSIDLPATWMPPRVALPTHIAALNLAAGMVGGLPEFRFTRRAGEAWRNSGGRLEVDQLGLEWGKLTLTAETKLDLDAALQPQGSGKLKAAGIAEAIDTMVAGGMLPASTGRAAKGVLMLIPKNSDGEIALPMSLSGRMLTVARFPLVRLPELVWPEPR